MQTTGCYLVTEFISPLALVLFSDCLWPTDCQATCMQKIQSSSESVVLNVIMATYGQGT